MRIRCHALFIDPRMSPPAQILATISRCMMDVAYKFYFYIKDSPDIFVYRETYVKRTASFLSFDQC